MPPLPSIARSSYRAARQEPIGDGSCEDALVGAPRVSPATVPCRPVTGSPHPARLRRHLGHGGYRAAMAGVIEIEGLRKEYRRLRGGRTVAVDGLDLEVPEGGVFGFLGPNGA